MPTSKTKSKSSKHSSRESTPKPADKPAETTERTLEVAVVSTSWSSWVWSDELKLYYRGKLGVDKKWEYDYAAVLAPVQDVSTLMLVEKTKEDLGLKLVYEPVPSYTYADLYTMDMVPESEAVAVSPEPIAEAKAVEKTSDIEKEDDAKEEEEKKKPEEKEPVQELKAAALKKLGRRKVKNWDRIVTYLEEEEKANKKWRKEMYRNRGRPQSREEWYQQSW